MVLQHWLNQSSSLKVLLHCMIVYLPACLPGVAPVGGFCTQEVVCLDVLHPQLLLLLV